MRPACALEGLCLAFPVFFFFFFPKLKAMAFYPTSKSISGSQDIREVIIAKHARCAFLSLRHCNFYQKCPQHYVSRKKKKKYKQAVKDLGSHSIVCIPKSTSVIHIFLFYSLTKIRKKKKNLFNFASQMFLIFVYFLDSLFSPSLPFRGCKQLSHSEDELRLVILQICDMVIFITDYQF